MSLDAMEMRDGYLNAALWTATDPDSGEPLDRQFDVGDFDEDSAAKALSVCGAFAHANAALLEAQDLDANMDSAQAGHDLWLTRNGHGAGFWEEEWGAGAPALKAATGGLGEAYVMVGEGDSGHRYLYITD
jgi:hypothetical protein